MRTGAEEQTSDGLRRKAPHRVRRDAASRFPVQHPLRHEAIGGVEDHERSSTKGSKDVLDQTLIAATLFPDRVTKVRGSFGDGHAITCAVPLGLCQGTVRIAARSTIGRYGSRFLPDSINNPYGAGSPYRSESPTNPHGHGLRIEGQ